MYSAEDSLSPNDDNIYLGRWLQGTGTWTIQHYFTECQNLFRGQVHDYVVTTANDIPGWLQSFSINGDAFFKYGLNVLDSLRNQDRFANFFTRQGCYQYRIGNNNLNQNTEQFKHNTYTQKTILFSNERDFEEWKNSNANSKAILYNSQGVNHELIRNLNYSTLSAGYYFLMEGNVKQGVVIVK